LTVLASLGPIVGYLALAGLVAGESLGIPLPGETALIAAALLAAHNQMNLVLIIAIAAIAAILGDNIGYLIGLKGGRRLLERSGPLHKHRKRLLEHGEPFFARHGAKAVFLGRWFTGLRITAAWLAGINRMHWLTFLMWNALGGIAWAISVGVLAYIIGPQAEALFGYVGVGGVVAVVALLAAILLWRWRRNRRAPTTRR
jgi:membrane-associated protein